MPAIPHQRRLDEFVADVARHLTAAWREEVPLVVSLDEDHPQVIDTVMDLETLHDALSGYPLPPRA